MTTPNTPLQRSNQIVFERDGQRLIVAANDASTFVVNGWTVGIAFKEVKDYVHNFNRNSLEDCDGGFFREKDHYILSHQGAKMTLSPEEGTAVVQFLSTYYGLG